MDKLNGNYLCLADRPELVPVLAGWFFDEWGQHNSNLTQEIIENNLKGRLNRDQVPLVIVQMLDGSPIASASIKIQEMETHPQYMHWLGSVYVLPKYRQQGIGSNLIRRTIEEAKRVGVEQLYLYTRNKEELYSKLGWRPIETPIYHGRQVIIMRQTLSVEERKN
jgi:GNAT superfamily N-acetyltransferase